MTALAPRERTGLVDLFWPFDSLMGPRPWDHDVMAMRMEEFVDGDELVVRAELPGVDPEKDVEITVTDGTLTVAAERHDERTTGEKGTGAYRSEFRYGSFRRQIQLPAGTDVHAVTATYADGILEVRMPTSGTEPAPHTVPVTRG